MPDLCKETAAPDKTICAICIGENRTLKGLDSRLSASRGMLKLRAATATTSGAPVVGEDSPSIKLMASIRTLRKLHRQAHTA
jgi:hypothetical protein